MMLTMRQGQVHDHALLMASMFRAIKYETMPELMHTFLQEQKNRNKTGGNMIKKIIAKAEVKGEDGAKVSIEESAEADEESNEKSDDDDDDDSNEDAGTESEENEEADGDGSNVDEDDIDVMLSEDDEDAKAQEQMYENESIEERVFVCIGK